MLLPMARARSHHVIAHTADAGISAVAGSPAELMEEAASALAEVMADLPRQPPPASVVTESISLEARDLTALAFAWLNELVGLGEIRRAAPAATNVEALSLDEAGEVTLRGQATFVRYGPDGARPRHHVKSVAMHGLEAAHRGDGWRLTAILDL